MLGLRWSFRRFGAIQGRIESKLREGLNPHHLAVENESHNHNRGSTESHFKVVVVSDQFDGKSALERHRLVHSLLKEELAEIHALALQATAPEHWKSD